MINLFNESLNIFCDSSYKKSARITALTHPLLSLFLILVSLTNTKAQTWSAPVVAGTVVGTGGNTGYFNSLTIVSGNPAMSYYDVTHGNLNYVRATNASGTAWGTPIIIDQTGNVGRFTSLAIVNGNPAISYYDATNGDLKYVRATDANGTAWGTPVTLESTGDIGWYTSLAIINGNPAISYYDVTNLDLKYVRDTEDRKSVV